VSRLKNFLNDSFPIVIIIIFFFFFFFFFFQLLPAKRLLMRGHCAYPLSLIILTQT